MLEHQPLLPFRYMPPRKPPASAPSSSSALAGPLSSSPSLAQHDEQHEQRDRDDVAVLLQPLRARSAPRVRPSTRGVWLEAASGQRLRHTPGATRNSSGSSGMTSFHITNRPVVGRGDQQPGDDERGDDAADPHRPPRTDRDPLRDLRVVGEGGRGQARPPRGPGAGAQRGRRAPGRRRPGCRARVRVARAERLERLPAQPLISPWLSGAQRDGARLPSRNAASPSVVSGATHAAGALQPAVGEQVQRAVALARLARPRRGGSAASRCGRAAAQSSSSRSGRKPGRPCSVARGPAQSDSRRNPPWRKSDPMPERRGRAGCPRSARRGRPSGRRAARRGGR